MRVSTWVTAEPVRDASLDQHLQSWSTAGPMLSKRTLWHERHTRANAGLMLTIVRNAGPALNQYWLNAS